ncbi:glycosyltransferase family 2 protein [Shewanella sp. 6_MG-2023]|uniref:glycosyltransferase family 2 protein n=1 Tax=Shewanella sp. 6_MG-2023 TaxID=3062660 RepID=UPI0026E24135|nr:glycosyltransferase [Shewanella sp. 6_MG-2023]MDO6617652.1 glycosyltransferase [Shewanella sp. 6_MG-2023]
MWFRKMIVTVAKLAMKCLPQKWVDILKDSPYLLAMYTKNIHHSGILYQLPTAAEAQKQYDQYLAFQEKRTQTDVTFNTDVNPLNIVICADSLDEKLFRRTLESINDSRLYGNIIVWSRAEIASVLSDISNGFSELSIVIVSELKQTFLSSELLNAPCFVVFSGDVIATSLADSVATHVLKNTKVAYVDTDIVWLGHQQRTLPDFKPDWNPDLQLTNGYIRSGVWLNSLRYFANTAPELSAFCIVRFLCEQYLNHSIKDVLHIPQILVSRPTAELSMNEGIAYLSDLLSEHSEIVDSKQAVFHLRWPLKNEPLVSLIIPTRNGKVLVEACIESILSKTDYPHYEILLVDNNSDEAESLQYFEFLAKHPKITVLKYPDEFNYSAINNFAVKHAKGSVIGLINNDIEVISPYWLTDMLGHVLRDDIGCVGAKLLYESNRIQHAGVILGYGGGAGHAHKFFTSTHAGYMNRLIASHNFSAVTAACLLVTKSDFEAVDGLNEQHLAIAFNDVDFCLKIQALGLRNLFCAEALLYHHESVSRGAEDTVEKQLRFKRELDYLQCNWADVIKHDPAYNPNLTLVTENFVIKDYQKESKK